MNCCHLYAPSISVASYKDSGISCNPARNRIILKPTVHQSVTTTILTHDKYLSASQNRSASIPMACNSVLINPLYGCNIKMARNEITATERILGRKNAPRKKVRNLVFKFANNANPSEDRKSTRLNSSHVKISYAVF